MRMDLFREALRGALDMTEEFYIRLAAVNGEDFSELVNSMSTYLNKPQIIERGWVYIMGVHVQSSWRIPPGWVYAWNERGRVVSLDTYN